MKVLISGKYAFVADWYGGVVILDITVPSTPQVVSGIYYEAMDVAVAGNYAYIVNDFELRVIDITDLAHPNMKASIKIDRGAWSIIVKDKYAFAGSDSSLLIFDIQSLVTCGSRIL